MKTTRFLFAVCCSVLLTVSVRASEPVGLVVTLQGSAAARDSAGTLRELQMKSEIFLHDTILTPSASRLQILFNDDSIFAQGENSEMTLDEYIFNPANQTDNAFGVRLGQGAFRTITGKITDLNPDRFSVKTSRATIGIRGCDLSFGIGPSEDRIAVFYVPPGKTVFIHPLQGDQRADVQTPTMVTVDDDGNLETRPLTSEDRAQAQQDTSPQSGSPASSDDPGPSGSGEGTASLEQDTVFQDTLAQESLIGERLLSETEIDQIIAGSTLYSLHGSGTASATINTYHGGMTPMGTYAVSGPASVQMNIGHGTADFTADIGLLQNGTGQSLAFQTVAIDFTGHGGGLAISDISDISSLSMHADGMWDQSHLTSATAEGELYGTGGNAAPTAARLVDGQLVLENQGDTAIVDFSTSKINLH